MPRSSAGRLDIPDAGTESTALLTAVQRTTLYSSGRIKNSGGQNLIVFLETTAIGTATLTLSIKAVNPVTGTTYTILVGTAVSTNLMTAYRVSPHLTAAANLIAKDIVPAEFQIDVAVGSAAAADYNIGLSVS